MHTLCILLCILCIPLQVILTLTYSLCAISLIAGRKFTRHRPEWHTTSSIASQSVDDVLQGFTHLNNHRSLGPNEASARHRHHAGALQPGHAQEFLVHTHGQPYCICCMLAVKACDVAPAVSCPHLLPCMLPALPVLKAAQNLTVDLCPLSFQHGHAGTR